MANDPPIMAAVVRGPDAAAQPRANFRFSLRELLGAVFVCGLLSWAVPVGAPPLQAAWLGTWIAAVVVQRLLCESASTTGEWTDANRRHALGLVQQTAHGTTIFCIAYSVMLLTAKTVGLTGSMLMVDILQLVIVPVVLWLPVCFFANVHSWVLYSQWRDSAHTSYRIAALVAATCPFLWFCVEWGLF